MNIDKLADQWERTAKAKLTCREYHLKLPVEDAARVEALAEMYPKRNAEVIIIELLNAALDELEASLPYVKGERVIGEDELGDPRFEDVGPTERFMELSRKYHNRLTSDLQQSRTTDATDSKD